LQVRFLARYPVSKVPSRELLVPSKLNTHKLPALYALPLTP
jgi:hypothetical protein